MPLTGHESAWYLIATRRQQKLYRKVRIQDIQHGKLDNNKTRSIGLVKYTKHVYTFLWIVNFFVRCGKSDHRMFYTNYPSTCITYGLRMPFTKHPVNNKVICGADVMTCLWRDLRDFQAGQYGTARVCNTRTVVHRALFEKHGVRRVYVRFSSVTSGQFSFCLFLCHVPLPQGFIKVICLVPLHWFSRSVYCIFFHRLANRFAQRFVCGMSSEGSCAQELEVSNC